MSIETILQQFTKNGICLRVDGNALQYAPRDAMTPELMALARTHKQAILQALSPLPNALVASEDWPETIDVREVTPCPKCGTLELWETLAGTWKCLRCDPPTRWRRFAAKHGNYHND